MKRAGWREPGAAGPPGAPQSRTRRSSSGAGALRCQASASRLYRGAGSRRFPRPSPALSFILNGPESFAGRKVGALVTDGADIDLIEALRSALEKEGAVLKLVAPMVGGIEASDGAWIEADEKIDGGPSVLFDAVALIASQAGADMLAREATARDFVADAFAHLKFIGCAEEATPLLHKAGVLEDRDEGVMPLRSADNSRTLVAACRKLRFWPHEKRVRQI
jgi:catalase